MRPTTATEGHGAPDGTATRRWICFSCGFVYDEALGLPDEGIAPGTRWEDVPADWYCPQCGTGKVDFEMVLLED
jgi:rubredoxin